MLPFLVSSTVCGTPKTARFMPPSCPQVGPQDGMGYLATSSFLPALGPLRQQSLCSDVAHLLGLENGKGYITTFDFLPTL